MMHISARPRWFAWLGWLAAGWLAALALLLDGSGAALEPRLDPSSNWVIGSAAIALLVLLFASLLQVAGLVQAARRREAGARLSWRLLRQMLLVALLPLLLLYLAALKFINSSIEGWFVPDIAQGFQNALAVPQRVMELEQLRFQGELRELAGAFQGQPAEVRDALLLEALDELGAVELTLFDGDRGVLASFAADPRFVLPRYPELVPAAYAAERDYLFQLEPREDGYVLHLLLALGNGRNAPLLQARFPLDPVLQTLAARIEDQARAYQRLSYLRGALRYTLSAVLSFVLLASALGAVFLALVLARRISQPIQRLAAATEAVAEGDLEVQLSEQGDDELTALARAFNRMTRRLAEADQRVRAGQMQLETERAYLAAVIERISSGVITFDARLRLTTANSAAHDLLESELLSLRGLTTAELAVALPAAAALLLALERGYLGGSAEWREEVVLADDRRLFLRAARLPEDAGLVAIFDDAGEVGRLQRETAWGEVARRLAHEIKNPLTPIQLAAERLRHRYLAKLGSEEGQVLDRATQTIVNQVDALKTMVNAFSEYAKAPRLRPERQALLPLVAEIVELYRGEERLEFSVSIDPQLPPLRLDSGRIRQLLHNLISNACEASPAPAKLRMQINAQLVNESSRALVELVVSDDGPGIDPAIIERIFEPYVSTKPKGSGLGLAIVKRIIDEHGGQIRAEQTESGGARFRIRLPV
jgi:nitrogen fixation/metabolism regulation signal transduction histidine kinase